MRKIRMFFNTIFPFLFVFNSPLFAGAFIQGDFVFILKASQYPSPLSRLNPSAVLLTYKGILNNTIAISYDKDTIIDLNHFLSDIDSSHSKFINYRILFRNTKGESDSVFEYDLKYRNTKRIYRIQDNLAKIFSFDTLSNDIDHFVFDYKKKKNSTKNTGNSTFEKWISGYEIYNTYDRNNYSLGSVWMLSIGINNYGNIRWENCESDAQSYQIFFKNQFKKNYGNEATEVLFNSYLLLDKYATRDSILGVLKAIRSKSAANDYFIFSFSGESNLFKNITNKFVNYFFPYDVIGYIDSPKNRNKKTLMMFSKT